jgi:hypothetical protein
MERWETPTEPEPETPGDEGNGGEEEGNGEE